MLEPQHRQQKGVDNGQQQQGRHEATRGSRGLALAKTWSTGFMMNINVSCGRDEDVGSGECMVFMRHGTYQFSD